MPSIIKTFAITPKNTREVERIEISLQCVPESIEEALCYSEDSPDCHSIDIGINPTTAPYGFAMGKEVEFYIWDIEDFTESVRTVQQRYNITKTVSLCLRIGSKSIK